MGSKLFQPLATLEAFIGLFTFVRHWASDARKHSSRCDFCPWRLRAPFVTLSLYEIYLCCPSWWQVNSGWSEECTWPAAGGCGGGPHGRAACFLVRTTFLFKTLCSVQWLLMFCVIHGNTLKEIAPSVFVSWVVGVLYLSGHQSSVRYVFCGSLLPVCHLTLHFPVSLRISKFWQVHLLTCLRNLYSPLNHGESLYFPLNLYGFLAFMFISMLYHTSVCRSDMR